MSDSVRPHRRQPTRLPRPWDSPGKNTGVSCQFLLQCMKVNNESEAAQSCPTPRDPMDCSLPGPSVHGIFQARVLQWGAIAFSEGNGYPLQYSCLANPMDRGARRATVPGVAKNWTWLASKHRRRQWHPTPVLLHGKSHGRRSLVGCSPWGC